MTAVCAHVYIDSDDHDLLDILADVQNSRLAERFAEAGKPVVLSGDIRPSDVAPVIAPGKDGEKALFPMKWGFQIAGRPLIINARLETAARKPTFQEAWAQHRCIIPASWYYEWEHLSSPSGQKKTGDKYKIRPNGASVTWLAGLYRIENRLPVFVILTREPTETLGRIHDRMPLILPEGAVDDWIRPDTDPESLLPVTVTDMAIERVSPAIS